MITASAHTEKGNTMKLPQYRLLKISSSRKGASIEAEWVDLVTCRECKAYDSECEWCKGLGLEMKPNDFCSYGCKTENSSEKPNNSND